jgi:GT2 family glycosyltransferase
MRGNYNIQPRRWFSTSAATYYLPGNANKHAAQKREALMKIEPISVCAIILAYGARTKQLHRVLAAVMEQGAGLVIIVANAVTNETHQMLADLTKIYRGRLKIVPSKENLGSAGGYRLGLSKALQESYEYLWLLDDDNLPQEGALAALLTAFSFHQHSIKKGELALQSLRESLPGMMDVVHKRCAPPLPVPASFIGFHIFNLWRDFKLFFPTKKPQRNPALNPQDNIIRLHWATYGGLFLHRDAIKTMGFPDHLFFIDMDDVAYTLKFTSQGGNIFLVPDSRLTDIEPLSNATGGRMSIYRRLKTLSPKRSYYQVRNTVYLNRTMFPGHPLMYLLNKSIYIVLLGLLALYYRRGDRFKLILRAAHDGEQGRLGKRHFENEL